MDRLDACSDICGAVGSKMMCTRVCYSTKLCTKSNAPWEGFAEVSVSCCLLSAIVGPSRPLDHISFEMFDDDVLKTAEDFHALGTGKKGFD